VFTTVVVPALTAALSTDLTAFPIVFDTILPVTLAILSKTAACMSIVVSMVSAMSVLTLP
jgi:hypothetical protein